MGEPGNLPGVHLCALRAESRVTHGLEAPNGCLAGVAAELLEVTVSLYPICDSYVIASLLLLW